MDKNEVPILDDQIGSCVAPKRLDRLRSDHWKGRLAEDANYLPKLQDHDDADRMTHIYAAVSGGLPNDPHLLVMPGSFGHAEFCVHMVEAREAQ